MNYYWIFEGEGTDKRAVCINLAHVVEVVAEDDGLIIHMSNGATHVHADDHSREFRLLLNRLAGE